MSLERAKYRVPLRDKDKELSYEAEALSYFKLIVSQRIAKVTKKDWCQIRDINYQKFSIAYKHLYIEGKKHNAISHQQKLDVANVRKINSSLDKNIIKKQDINEFLDKVKDTDNVPGLSQKNEQKDDEHCTKKDKKEHNDPENGRKRDIKRDIYSDEAFSEDAKGTKKTTISNKERELMKQNVLYDDFSSKKDINFNIHCSRWKTLQACAFALEDIAFNISQRALKINKPIEMRQMAATIKDIQQSFREMVPDYLASKERVGTIMVLEALKSGEIDVVEAAISFDIAGVPMPDSVKLLMQKYIEPEKEEDKPMITHEEIEQRRLEVLENIRNQIDAQPTKAREVEDLKAGLRGQLSYDIEAAIEKED